MTLFLAATVPPARATPLLAEPPVATSFRFPLDGDWNVIRGFADKWWPKPICGYHLGHDIPRYEDENVSVYAPAAGVVRYASIIEKAGYVVNIEHKLPDGSYVVSAYFHLKRPLEGGKSLEQDQVVTQGELIGYISAKYKDHQSIPHLHFGIRKGQYKWGIDARTNRWFYPGYTTVYKKTDDPKNPEVKQCNKDDPTHQEIISEWYDPKDFIVTVVPSVTPTPTVTPTVTRTTLPTAMPTSTPKPAPTATATATATSRAMTLTGKIASVKKDGIYVVNTDGSGLRQLTFAKPDGLPTDSFAVWSPDGKKIAFERAERWIGGLGTRWISGGLYIIGQDGTGLKRLLTFTDYIGARPVWSPSGNHIAFNNSAIRFC